MRPAFVKTKHRALFENFLKCRIELTYSGISTNFIKVTCCLVGLFYRKLQIVKIRQNGPFGAFLMSM